MTATQIETAYNELMSSIDRESRRLRQTLAEQEMKDEEERLKKIQVKHKRISIRQLYRIFRMNLNEKKQKKLMKINNLNKKKKNFDSRNFHQSFLFLFLRRI